MDIIIKLVLPIFSMLFTVLFHLLDTYQVTEIEGKTTFQERKSKNKTRIFCKWCLVLLPIICFALFYLNYNEDRKAQDIYYNDLYVTILSEINTGQYSTAVQKIDIQINHIEDDQKYKNFAFLKATCILNEAVNINDYTEQIQKFEEVLTVIKEFQSKNLSLSEYEKIQLKIIMGFSYLYLNNDTYKNDLEDTRKYLEKIREKENSFEDLKDIDLFLGLYYEIKYDKDSSDDNLKNTIHYYKNLTEKDVKFKILINRDVNESYIMKVANYYLKSGITKVGENERELIFCDKESSMVRDAIKNIKESLSIYNKIISNCDIKKNNSIYYECLKNQGACYCWLLILGEVNQKHIKKAYNNFRKFIKADLKQYDYLMDGIYVNFWLGLPQKEADMIIKRYKRLLKSYESSSNIAMAAEIRYQIAVCYQKMSVRYRKKSYYKNGKKFLSQIRLEYYDYFNDNRKKMIKDLRAEYADISLFKKSKRTKPKKKKQ